MSVINSLFFCAIFPERRPSSRIQGYDILGQPVKLSTMQIAASPRQINLAELAH